MKKILLVVPSNKFEDDEYNLIKNLFEEKKFTIETVSSVKEAKSKLGKRLQIDYAFDKIKLQDYTGVIFIGGPGAIEYYSDMTAHALVHRATRQNKLLIAIGNAVMILANAGVLKDKKATTTSQERDKLKTKGVEYSSENVVVEGNIITVASSFAIKDLEEKLTEK